MSFLVENTNYWGIAIESSLTSNKCEKKTVINKDGIKIRNK